MTIGCTMSVGTLPKTIHNNVIKQLTDLKNSLDQEFKNLYLKRVPWGQQSPTRFYGLPKIHKPDVLLRQIISACGTSTYILSKFLTTHNTHCTKRTASLLGTFLQHTQRQNYCSPGTCFEQLCVLNPTQVLEATSGSSYGFSSLTSHSTYLHGLF